MKIEETRLRGESEGLSEKEIEAHIEEIKATAHKQFNEKKKELKKES